MSERLRTPRRRPSPAWALAAGAAAAIATAAGCVDTVPVEGFPCPCAEGFYCCPGQRTCLEEADLSCWPDEVSVPRVIASGLGPKDARAARLHGDLLLVAGGNAGLWIYDASVTRAPALLAELSVGSAHDLAAADDVAFVAAGETGVVSVDISAPGAPQVLDAFNDVRLARAVVHDGSHVYVADDTGGLLIVDVSVPSDLRHAATVPSRGRTVRAGGVSDSATSRVAVQGGFAYVADGDGGLVTLDVTEPTAPLFVSRFPEDRFEAPVFTFGVHVTGTTAMLADGRHGLQLVDLSTPAAPVTLGAIGLPCRDVSVLGDHALLAGELGWTHIVGVADPESLTHVGVVYARGVVGSIEVVGDRAFIASAGAGLALVDLSEIAP